jgi:hypothetical protein
MVGLVLTRLTRLEYLTPDGWVEVGTHPLLYPEAFPARLWRNRKIARAVEVDSGVVHHCPIADPSGAVGPVRLARVEDGTPYPWRVVCCDQCAGQHGDGECLL